MPNSKLDISELKEKVLDKWEEDCVEFFEVTDVDIKIEIKDKYSDILDDPLACVRELGFNSIDEYLSGSSNDDEYQAWLNWLDENEIEAPEWVKTWTKELLSFEKGN